MSKKKKKKSKVKKKSSKKLQKNAKAKKVSKKIKKKIKSKKENKYYIPEIIIKNNIAVVEKFAGNINIKTTNTGNHNEKIDFEKS